MRMLRMCLNPRVIAALAAVAVGIYVLAPGLFAAALPLLVLAACPLSMLIMMRAMGGMGGMGGAAETGSTYACPMHPAARSGEPGVCPSCGMQLQPTRSQANADQPSAPGAASTDALELQRRLEATVAEQARLRRELDAVRVSAGTRTELLAAADRVEADVDAELAKTARESDVEEQPRA